ncbi:MAG: DUF983 domain-containing protein [Sphingobacteriales bacterium]|nr:MAG: DUF983 domain-containing protein [Sphingobacteriales bacterium]
MFKSLKAIVACKCPKCKEGNLFVNPNPYVFKDLDKMYDNCPKCNFDLRNETGFYWFSMYISYILSTAITIANFVVFGLLFGFLEHIVTFIIINAIILIILLPFIFRWSRILSIYLTLKVDKN